MRNICQNLNPMGLGLEVQLSDCVFRSEILGGFVCTISRCLCICWIGSEFQFIDTFTRTVSVSGSVRHQTQLLRRRSPLAASAPPKDPFTTTQFHSAPVVFVGVVILWFPGFNNNQIRLMAQEVRTYNRQPFRHPPLLWAEIPGSSAH